tara:strand:+ start:425 stop:1594 length:1170 start_codon:yes stop_codon:yes gene_type:complete
MNDVVIEKVNGGLGRRNPSGDMISGLVANGVAIVGGAQLATVYRLKSVKDAESLLITESYDSTNSVLVYEHINEFFRANPSGDLYLMLAPQTESYSNLVDKTKDFSAKLLIEAEGKIRQLAVAYNPATAVTDFTATSGAITKAQELADESYTKHRPVQILLEGKGFDYSTPVDFRALNSKNVSVMIGQSLVIANTSPTYAAVGTLLGTVSKTSVNENIAWVGKYNLYGGSLTVASISGVAVSSISDGDLDTLNDKGSIFFRTHIGRAGYYFNDSHTCIALTSDFAYIENNRTIDKAVREIRIVLLPRLNSTVLVDGDGKLSPEVIKSYESDGRRALEQMLKSEEVSDFDVLVDPDQNILSTSELLVDFELIPTGTARKIKATVGFVNPF